MQKHKCKDGTVLEIRDMTDGHLHNTIKALERRAEEGILFRGGGGGEGPDDYWYDEEEMTGQDALDRMEFYKDYIKERNRREKKKGSA